LWFQVQFLFSLKSNSTFYLQRLNFIKCIKLYFLFVLWKAFQIIFITSQKRIFNWKVRKRNSCKYFLQIGFIKNMIFLWWNLKFDFPDLKFPQKLLNVNLQNYFLSTYHDYDTNIILQLVPFRIWNVFKLRWHLFVLSLMFQLERTFHKLSNSLMYGDDFEFRCKYNFLSESRYYDSQIIMNHMIIDRVVINKRFITNWYKCCVLLRIVRFIQYYKTQWIWNLHDIVHDTNVFMVQKIHDSFQKKFLLCFGRYCVRYLLGK